MIHDNRTIVAPATALGGAIAVIRVSGSEALATVDRIFRGRTHLADAPGHTVRFGRIVDAERTVDEVLVTLFRAPHSYTGEEAAEISCHGSQYVVREILRLLIASGARMAEPGEFTVRAYLNGKLDLSQAEAVADLIASSSRAAHTMAINQLRGGYSAALDTLRDELLRLTSLLELELDFSEEDVEFADRRELETILRRIGSEISRLRDSFALGNALKSGIPVAIVGAPNAGKSTLLNRLLDEERAMVSEIPGTTRDVIEECLTIDGVEFRFLDTAGIRTTDDRLERMGIERTLSSIARAHSIIRLVEARDIVDGQLPARDFPLRDDQHLLTIVSKIDTAPGLALPADAFAISARSSEGIDRLTAALRATVDTASLSHGDTVVSNSRHFEALSAAGQSLAEALSALRSGLPTDLLSEEIRAVIRHLCAITGRGAITPDEVLGTIFSKFCIGK